MRSQRFRVSEVRGGAVRNVEDHLAVEEPLQIRLATPAGSTALAITMRTPGHDLELTAGFLLSEGVLRRSSDVRTLRHCSRAPLAERDNTVTADLSPEACLRASARPFTVTSACGVCGAQSVAALADRGVSPVRRTPVDPATVLRLPERLRQAQRTFDRTGGLHAAGLFGVDGEMLVVREDVGRHNAVDKVLGWALHRDLLPLHGHALVVSGRSSFELVHKAVVAGVGMLAGVSAPSSLAVELARRYELALAGFVREERFVLYSGELVSAVGAAPP